MTPKSKPQIRLTQIAYSDLKRIPGNTRRPIIEAIDQLQKQLRPNNSKHLTVENEQRVVRRLRLGKWRIIYLIIERVPIIIGIRSRPPYDYQDIENLIESTEQ